MKIFLLFRIKNYVHPDLFYIKDILIILPFIKFSYPVKLNHMNRIESNWSLLVLSFVQFISLMFFWFILKMIYF